MNDYYDSEGFRGKNGLKVDHYCIQCIQCTAMLKGWTEKHSWHRLVGRSKCNGATTAGLTTYIYIVYI